jgi:hypothetical protein
MAATLQDRVTNLLSKDIVQPKIRGVPRPDIETASVVESLALTMMLHPRSALYAHYLAKNGLVIAIDAEVAAIDVLKKSIQDLSNVTYAIKDTKALGRARSALLQLATQGRVSAESSAFTRYSDAVDDFLTLQLAKNVRRPGATELSRPGQEAAIALPSDLEAVKTAHMDLLDRLYALAVGAQNFLSIPFNAMVGANAVYRTKKDLDVLLAELAEDDSGTQSRDAVTRLLAGRATIRTLSTSVVMEGAVVDTLRQLPGGRRLSGVTPSVPPSVTSTPGPFLNMAMGMFCTVNGEGGGGTLMSQASNAPAVLSEEIAYPVAVSTGATLLLHLEAIPGLTWTQVGDYYSEPTLGGGWSVFGTTYGKVISVNLNTDPTMPLKSLPMILASITSGLGLYGSAVEFVSDTNRILVIASEPKIQTLSVVPPSGPLLGFVSDVVGVHGTPAKRVVYAMNELFNGLIIVTLNSDQSITLTSTDSTPGAKMHLWGTAVTEMGFSTEFDYSFVAYSDSVMLVEDGVSVSPIGLVDVGDVLSSPTGSSTIKSLSSTVITLDTPIPTFLGPVTVTSGLYLVWEELTRQLDSFLGSWVIGPYASDLTALDQVIAVLVGSPTSPRRSEAVVLLDDLRTKLLSLRAGLTSTTATLPAGGGSQEKVVVQGILDIFTERKFTRAIDLFLRCKLQEVFQIDWQTASYSGDLMKAAEAIAQNDIKFPDSSKDEGFEVLGVREVSR